MVISANKRERLMALVAVGVGMIRPLLDAAIILRGNERVVRELRRVFPRHRQVIERIRRLSQEFDRQLPERSETAFTTAQETHGPSQQNYPRSLCWPRVRPSLNSDPTQIVKRYLREPVQSGGAEAETNPEALSLWAFCN